MKEVLFGVQGKIEEYIIYFIIKWILERVEKMRNGKGSSNKYQNNFIYLFEAATEFTSEDEGKCEM